jgi:glycerol-1-phosphate dehydrogenase [NAD(P)+]
LIIENLPKITISSLASIHERRKSLILTQDPPWKQIKQLIKIENKEVLFFDKIVSEEVLNDLNKEVSSGTEVIYGIGGGAIIDTAKYLAFSNSIKLVAIPTIISNDAFLAYETAIREGGVVKYIKSKQPDLVYLDFDLIAKAPKRLNICGCSDILSIFTGSFDWKLANFRGVAKDDELFDESIFQIALSVMRGVEQNKAAISRCTKQGLKKIVDLLCMETRINNNFGNARVEEGSEHFFTYAIEKITNLSFLHGEMVALGILLMSYYQGQDVYNMKHLLDYLGIKFRETGATKQQVVETLLQLKDFVTAHNYRFTIINELDISREEAEKVVDFILQ